MDYKEAFDKLFNYHDTDTRFTDPLSAIYDHVQALETKLFNAELSLHAANKQIITLQAGSGSGETSEPTGEPTAQEDDKPDDTLSIEEIIAEDQATVEEAFAKATDDPLKAAAYTELAAETRQRSKAKKQPA